MDVLERLGERNSETAAWAFRQIRNYGPKDQGFLDATDFDMILEIATWVAESKKKGGGTAPGVAGAGGIAERTVAPGVTQSTIATDPASFKAFEQALAEGKSWDEALAIMDSTPSTAARDAAASDTIMRQLLGASYQPPG